MEAIIHNTDWDLHLLDIFPVLRKYNIEDPNKKYDTDWYIINISTLEELVQLRNDVHNPLIIGSPDKNEQRIVMDIEIYDNYRE